MGIDIIDISDPENPVHVGNIAFDYTPGNIVVAGNTVFIPQYIDGLLAYDVSDPSNATLVGSFTDNFHSYSMVKNGSYAYVPNYDNMLIIDVSDPSNMSLVGSCPVSSYTQNICVSGSIVCVFGYDNGIEIIDASDPANPFVTGGLDVGVYNLIMKNDGNRIWVSTTSEVFSFDISNPSDPQCGGSYHPNYDAYPAGFCLSGGYMFLAAGADALLTLDVSDPATPTVEGNWHEFRIPKAVYASGDYAFTASYWMFDVLDVSDPDNVFLAATLDMYNECIVDVFVSGNRAYVGGYFGGFHIIDVSDPLNPALIGNCNTDVSVKSIVVEGNTAFVNLANDRMALYDVSDPANPVLDCAFDATGIIQEIHPAGEYAYIAAGNEGLLIVDVSDPSAPVLTGSFATNGTAVSVSVCGDYAYVADCDNLLIIDVSNPSSPSLAGSVNSYSTQVRISDGHAVVLGGSSSYGPYPTSATKSGMPPMPTYLNLMDLSNPLNPMLIDTASLSSSTGSIQFVENKIYTISCYYSNFLAVLQLGEETP